MSHTSEQRKQYWKIRIGDKINSVQGQLRLDKEGLLEIAEHAGLTSVYTKITQEFGGIEIAFANILTELERKESEDEKPKQSNANRKPHKRAGA